MTRPIERVLVAYYDIVGEYNMGKITNKIKKTVIKIDDFREEKLEDFISKEILEDINVILEKADKSKRLDELEKKAIIAGIKAGNAYFSQYGTLPDTAIDAISQCCVDAIGKGNKIIQKANEKIQKKLEKKSKAYIARHKEVKSDNI